MRRGLLNTEAGKRGGSNIGGAVQVNVFNNLKMVIKGDTVF